MDNFPERVLKNTQGSGKVKEIVSPAARAALRKGRGRARGGDWVSTMDANITGKRFDFFPAGRTNCGIFEGINWIATVEANDGKKQGTNRFNPLLKEGTTFLEDQLGEKKPGKPRNKSPDREVILATALVPATPGIQCKGEPKERLPVASVEFLCHNSNIRHNCLDRSG
jgi:hypothetical protein